MRCSSWALSLLILCTAYREQKETHAIKGSFAGRMCLSINVSCVRNRRPIISL